MDTGKTKSPKYLNCIEPQHQEKERKSGVFGYEYIIQDLKMNIFDYLRRINGFSISTPVFGVGLQWADSENEGVRRIAWETISFLENRRVLFVEGEAEVPMYCIKSVDEIRFFLTNTISNFPTPKNEKDITDLEICLREMRAACQMMMTSYVASDLTEPLGSNYSEKKLQELDFIMSLVALRSVFALNINKISKIYKIPIRENRLKEIIDSYV